MEAALGRLDTLLCESAISSLRVSYSFFLTGLMATGCFLDTGLSVENTAKYRVM